MLQEPPIPIQKLSEVRKQDVRRYTPDDSITINIRWCKHCRESVGLDYIDECAAEACSDLGECPYSAEWDGDACGYIVCPHCHHPAKSREWTVDDASVADMMADKIGRSGDEAILIPSQLVESESKEGSA